MTFALAFGVLVFSIGATALLTGRLLPYLKRRSMLDRPNERGLHSAPVPRGAGLAITGVVLLVQACIFALEPSPWLSADAVWWLGGASFALLGWWDDYRSRSTALRLFLQFVIAGVFTTVALPDLAFAGSPVPAFLLIGVATILVVWVVNLFNFMDGADGFAGTQSVLYSAAAVALLMHSGAAKDAMIAAAVTGATLGFLYWNRAPARVFMGDSGSYFLGFQLAAFAIAGMRHGQSIAPWIVLLTLFIVDASFTLVRRLLTGEPWWKAHRTHAYQVLVLKGWSPNRLVTALAALNLFIYWPLATWAVIDIDSKWIATLLAAGLAGMIWFMIMRDHRLPAANH